MVVVRMRAAGSIQAKNSIGTNSWWHTMRNRHHR